MVVDVGVDVVLDVDVDIDRDRDLDVAAQALTFTASWSTSRLQPKLDRGIRLPARSGHGLVETPARLRGREHGTRLLAWTSAGSDVARSGGDGPVNLALVSVQS